MLTAIIWVLSLWAFCFILTRATKIKKTQHINVDFEDYKEKELGKIELPNDYKEF